MTEGRVPARAPRWLSLTAAAVALVVSASSAAWALWPDMQASFGPIDDHEPLRWMGSDGALSPMEFGSTLFGNTELVSFGNASRYRPAYYAVRVLQTVAFGSNPTAWYASVIVAFVFACALLGFVVARWVTLALRADQNAGTARAVMVIAAAALATAGFATMPAWRGIATRLGPSELLAALALGLLLLGSTLILEGRSSWWWALLLASTWLAVGSKESMLPLALVPTILAVDRVRAGGRRPWLAVAAVVAAIPAVIVVAAVLPPVLAGGSAGYGSTGDGSRTALALTGLLNTYRWYWLPALATLVGSLLVFAWSRMTSRRLVGTLMALAVLSIMWFTYDMWVYSGSYPLPRYELNTQVIKILWISAAVGLGGAVLADPRHRSSRWVAWLPLLGALGLSATTLFSAPANLSALHAEADRNASATRQYRNQMDAVLASLRANPVDQVVLFAREVMDEEPVHAISQEIQLAVTPSPQVLVGANAPLSMQERSSSGAERVCIFINDDPDSGPPCTGESTFRVDARGM